MPDFEEIYQVTRHCLPMLEQLSTTPQDPEWHEEGNVFIHSRMTLESVYHLIGEERLESTALQKAELILSAALHDIAKAVTTREADIEGVRRIVAPHHAERGRSYLGPSLLQLGLAPRSLMNVINLVGLHHHPRRFVRREEKVGSYWKLARNIDLNQLITLCEADVLGRISSTSHLIQTDHELFDMFTQEHLQGLTPMTPEWVEIINEHLEGYDENTRRFVLSQSIWEAEQGMIFSPYEAIARSFEYRDEYAQLTIMCAPSGAGKSTWIERYQPDADIISLDALRAELARDIRDQSMNGVVIQVAKTTLKQLLNAKKKIVWDATNLRAEHRAQLISIAMDYRAFVRIEVLCISAEEAQSRNSLRERQVPQDVINAQFQKWDWPLHGEAHEVGYWFPNESGEWVEV